jgi:hypothetical protein
MVSGPRFLSSSLTKMNEEAQMILTKTASRMARG